MIKLIIKIIFLSLFICVPMTVFAQDSKPTYEDKESAKIHFEAAKQLYKNNKYSEALEMFMKAYSRYPRPEILYNIGKCYDKLGDYQNAIKFYEQYLLLNPQSDDRLEVEELIKNLKIAIEKPDKKAEKHSSDKIGIYRITGYSLAASGLLFVGLGPVFYLKSDDIFQDLKEHTYDDKTRASKIDDIRFYDNLSVVSYITGGILLGSSIYFFYKGYYESKTAMILPYGDGLYFALSGVF